MFSWLYYNAKELETAEKTMIFLLDKKCRIASDPKISNQLKQEKANRINFLLDCIKYKYGITI
jgi:hypothetical protein